MLTIYTVERIGKARLLIFNYNLLTNIFIFQKSKLPNRDGELNIDTLIFLCRKSNKRKVFYGQTFI